MVATIQDHLAEIEKLRHILGEVRDWLKHEPWYDDFRGEAHASVEPILEKINTALSA